MTVGPDPGGRSSIGSDSENGRVPATWKRPGTVTQIRPWRSIMSEPNVSPPQPTQERADHLRAAAELLVHLSHGDVAADDVAVVECAVRRNLYRAGVR